MPALQPVAPDAVDPSLAPHLEPGETVLWQGAPPPDTFVPKPSAPVAATLVVFGLALLTGWFDRITGIPLGDQPRLIPSLAIVAAGAATYLLPRLGARAPRRYAITDRRLVVVKGGKLFDAVRPREIRDFGTRGKVAYWRRLRPTSSEESRQPEKRYPGFHGLDDPEDMRRTLETWRESFSAKAEAAAAAFVAGVSGSEGEEGAGRVTAGHTPVPDGARRIRHPETGLTLDVPAGWPVTVRLDRDGPLTLFGVTLLKRVIRPGKERPLGDGAPWNVLVARGGPDAGVTMTLHPTPIPQTYDEVLNDPWAERFGLEMLKSTPELRVGPFRGYSLVRQMPQGANLQGFGAVAAPVAVRQIWLGRDGMHVHFIGMARLDQPDTQRAVDAAVASLQVS